MMNDCRNQLESFYRANGLLVSDFHCQHEAACRTAVGCDLHLGSEAHVGTRYGEGLRVVVVSLDTGGKGQCLDEKHKTIESLYRPDGDTPRMNPHMRGTTKLLQEIYGTEPPNADGGNLYELYAMTNAAKCSLSSPGTAKVPDKLFKNCSGYVAPELACLAPQLIVTQGKEAWRALRAQEERLSECHQAVIDAWIAESSAHVVVRECMQSLATEYLRTVSVEGWGEVPAIKTIHPSARAGQWQRFVRTGLRPVVAMAKHLVRSTSV